MVKLTTVKRAGSVSLNVPCYDGAGFDWHGAKLARKGFAEASSLGLPPGKEPGERVWADSADVGFVVRSHRTGVEALFTLVGPEYVFEGQVSGWYFVSDAGVGITVFND